RGRSLVNSFVIIDEAQNCSINQILEIVTRAGEGTKIVLLGDPDQIDNPKLDRRNNGLVFASERMKGSDLCAQVTFKDSETVRSRLSSEAAKRLTIE
ncbi:MAG: PhoH family protein, partial [Lachnospiraceae bacterium]|nr:PhoH family protein [Lachnospiraceae bacterium]